MLTGSEGLLPIGVHLVSPGSGHCLSLSLGPHLLLAGHPGASA